VDEKQVGLESAEAFEESLEPDPGEGGDSAAPQEAGGDSSGPLRLLETHEDMPAVEPEPSGESPAQKPTPKPSESRKSSESDGIDSIGIYDAGTGVFFLRDDNDRGIAHYAFRFGPTGAKPFAGDWDGDGVDTVGTYGAEAREFALRNTHDAGAADERFRFGGSGVRPIAGNWDGE